MSADRFPCTIAVQPWFQDHAIDGGIVLPAVETMLFLAADCLKTHPEADVRVMETGLFGKFLEIPPTASTVGVLVEYSKTSNGRIRTKLLSHRQYKTMARIKEHGEIFFPPRQHGNQLPANIDPAPPTRPVREIGVEQLYRELVPFGPHYRTLQHVLYLGESEAWGRLRAPELPFVYPAQELLGSPFPLDGALHAACVLGRQSVDFAPFPVGFARRIVSRPTQPGANYLTRVTMTSLTRDELTFDVTLFNDDGQLYETVTGIRMRDVRRAVKLKTEN